MIWEDIGLTVTVLALLGIGLLNWVHSRPINWDEEDPITEARSARSE